SSLLVRAWFLFTALYLTVCFFFVSVEAKTSEDVILPCRSPSERAIKLLKWKKQDKDLEGFVFFFRENRSYESYQIPSFKHRVQLSDPRMKDGDVSVTVKNVTSSDSGEYECSFHISRKHRSRRATDFSYTVKLTVVDGESDMKLVVDVTVT
uniref:Ig-like domain-containing protein n=1 Tax=Amphiprion ocellaris TaxID=80972 RepID=A0AAQ5Z121_AMPOC